MIQDPSLNIEGATEDKVCEIDLKDYLDPAMTIAGLDNTKVTVTLRVEVLRDRNFSVEARDITLTGRDGQYSYSVSTENTGITIRGLKEDLDSLSTSKMNLGADVSDLGAGVHQVEVSMQLDDAFIIVKKPQIEVTITERSSAQESTGAGETSESVESSAGDTQASGTDGE